MTNYDSTLFIDQRPVKCEHCGYYCDPSAAACPRCGEAIRPPAAACQTMPLNRTPRTTPVDLRGNQIFPPNHLALLQFLPSGVCVSLDIQHPIILGRHPQPGENHVVDLTGLNVTQHGISRRHCMLQRYQQGLVVLDLDSLNGTYLNGERLPPNEPFVVASGDELILGTLHLNIVFAAP